MYKRIIDPHTEEPKSDVVLRISDGVFIPFAKGNTDYAAYQAWLAAGNEPEAPDGEAE